MALTTIQVDSPVHCDEIGALTNAGEEHGKLQRLASRSRVGGDSAGLVAGAFMTDATASTVDLGNVSSATGSLSLSGTTFGVPTVIGTDAYSFTLKDDAKVSGDFSVGFFPLVPLNIDLMSGGTTLVHTTATLGLSAGGFVIVPDQISLFSLDLTPGTYLLTFLGSFNTFSGTLAFGPTSVAATPIPAALPLFASALGGLGLLGWRRRRKACAS